MLCVPTAQRVPRDVLPDGWSEASPGGLATNPDPITGGIIDRTIACGEWFVIFHNEDLSTLEGFATRDQAFAACLLTLKTASPSPRPAPEAAWT